jgi:hypothetical protein
MPSILVGALTDVQAVWQAVKVTDRDSLHFGRPITLVKIKEANCREEGNISFVRTAQ